MTSTTGTGASGEIRETRPQTNSSKHQVADHQDALALEILQDFFSALGLHYLSNWSVGTQMITALASFTRVKSVVAGTNHPKLYCGLTASAVKEVQQA
jgi:hypothetical protein